MTGGPPALGILPSRGVSIVAHVNVRQWKADLPTRLDNAPPASRSWDTPIRHHPSDSTSSSAIQVRQVTKDQRKVRQFEMPVSGAQRKYISMSYNHYRCHLGTLTREAADGTTVQPPQDDVHASYLWIVPAVYRCSLLQRTSKHPWTTGILALR